MKFTIDVDCTPEEARRFLGLPDVGPIQEKMLAEMEKRMQESMNGFDMETLMKQWLSPGPGGSDLNKWNEVTQAFWQQMSGFPKGGKEDQT